MVTQRWPFVTEIGNEMLAQVVLGPITMIVFGETQREFVGEVLNSWAISVLDVIDRRNDCGT